MKNENDKVKAFALEVIEKIESMSKTHASKYETEGLVYAVQIVQSLIPKEEIIEPSTKTDTTREVNMENHLKDAEFYILNKTESEEVKDKIVYTETDLDNAIDWAIKKGREGNVTISEIDTFINSLKQPTLEQKARKKAEEIFENKIAGRTFENEDIIRAIKSGIEIDPKTL